MPLGYDGQLYILAFDHRGSFQSKMFGIDGEPDNEQTARIADAKRLIFEGMVAAAKDGQDPSMLGVLVDEQFGSDIPQQARRAGLKLAMPVERSGQDTFDFEYGEAFGEHITRFDPDFSKVLVRFNPDEPDSEKRLQLDRLARLSDWLRTEARKFLFELLVPATETQLSHVDGDLDRYDAELRPDLMVRSIAEIQNHGIEVDVWKIEGMEQRADCERVVAQCRKGGRDGVVCVLLGRGADDSKVDHWLTQASPVEGFVGFAIGRSIWWDTLERYLAGDLERGRAARQIADNFTRFIATYRAAI